MKEDLKSVANLVKAILVTDPRARNSDSYLYLKVLEHISSHEGYGFKYMTVEYFLENMDYYGFPAFESVRRTRQKVQAAFPELGAERRVKRFRNSNEAEYRAFATEPCLFCEDAVTVCPECGKGVQNG